MEREEGKLVGGTGRERRETDKQEERRMSERETENE